MTNPDRDELVKLADRYLAENAAESGTDELIRMLVKEIRLMDSQFANCHKEIFALRDEVERIRAETIRQASDALGIREEYLVVRLRSYAQ